MTNEEIINLTPQAMKEMPAGERISVVNDIRSKISKDRKSVPDEVVKNGLRLVRIERNARQNSPKARNKAPAPSMSLDELL